MLVGSPCARFTPRNLLDRIESIILIGLLLAERAVHKRQVDVIGIWFDIAEHVRVVKLEAVPNERDTQPELVGQFSEYALKR